MQEIWQNIVTAFTENPIRLAVDFVLTALLLYAVFAFIKKNNASRLIKYVVILAVLVVVLSSDTVGLPVIGKIASYAVVITTVVIVVMFPQELRRGLWKISSHKSDASTFSTHYDCSDEDLRKAIDSIVRAAQNMAKKNVGALMVIAPKDVPEHILESGTALDSKLSCPLLECLFNTKAPLHDGAVFIKGDRIIAAGCFLPLTESTDVDKELGTRHRAGIGITENLDVLTIIVSEETGVISVAKGGELVRYYDAAMLTDTLQQIYGLKAAELNAGAKSKKRRQ